MVKASPKHSSIEVVVPVVTPRVRYTFDVLGSVIGCHFQCVSDRIGAPEERSLNYLPKQEGDGPWIPWDGFLGETGVREDYNLNAEKDLPAAIFYLLSDYEKYQAQHYDQHERYDQKAYPSSKLGLEHNPMIHIWGEEIRDLISRTYPEMIFHPPPSELRFTIDVDNPWRYKHKKTLVSFGGIVKSLTARNFPEVIQRIKVLSGLAPDPNYTFNELRALLPPGLTTYFALIDRNSPYDGRFTYRTPALRQLLLELAKEGNAVGIHPSYTSFQDPDRLKAEVGFLEEILGRNVLSSRQHFLRFRYPDTYRGLMAAGIREDYTPCLLKRGGFPHGMARPFPWYDLLNEQETELILYPTVVMDRSLQQYAGMAPEQAAERIMDLWKIVQDKGGIFTLLLHNECLSETGEWVGWSRAIVTMIEELKQGSCES